MLNNKTEKGFHANFGELWEFKPNSSLLRMWNLPIENVAQCVKYTILHKNV